MNNFKKLNISNLEEIETDQLIWDIEHSKDFYIYEINDNDNSSEILVKIINKDSSIRY